VIMARERPAPLTRVRGEARLAVVARKGYPRCRRGGIRLSVGLVAIFVLVTTVATRAADAPGLERRCGWISNPSPGNWEFLDKDGTWGIADQGGDNRVLDGLPDDRPSGKRWWVATQSGGYGYGCMCLNVQVQKKEKRFMKIDGGKSLLLAKCRKDPAIKNLEPRVD